MRNEERLDAMLVVSGGIKDDTVEMHKILRGFDLLDLEKMFPLLGV